MEQGSSWGIWLAYAAIVVFLLLVFVVFVRTMMLYATLTLMPLTRVFRRIERFFRAEKR